MELSIAVIPLVISAAEHYKTTYDALRRLQHSSSEAESLRIQIRVQRAIFNDNCRKILIHSGLEDFEADCLLKNSSHPGWSEKSLQRKVKQALGELFIPFKDTIKLTALELSGIEERLNSRAPAVLAVLKPHLERRIDRIRALNGDLNHIRGSIDNVSHENYEKASSSSNTKVFAPSSQQGHGALPGGGRNISKELEKFRSIREVSAELFVGLSRACRDHSEHQTLFNLSPQVNSRSQRVKFELALRVSTGKPTTSAHGSSSTPPANLRLANERVLWLSVEAPTRVQNHHKTPVPHLLNGKWQVPDRVQREPQQTLVHRPHKEEEVKSLNSENGLCRRVHEVSGSCKARSCIGSLENRLQVYLVPNDDISSGASVPTNLVELLQRSRTSPTGKALNDLERVRLAYNLATSVLIFHSTPWLLPSWNIDQILLLESETVDSQFLSHNQEPYVDATVSEKLQPAPQSLEGSEQRDSVLIENAFLYRLGVILLELAFEKPLRELRKSSTTSTDQETDYYTAFRHKSEVSRLMGRQYARVIDQCLKCNFGCGMVDLDSANLQMEVYSDILCQLKSLENTLQPIWT